ncbi:PLP-dependent aminotransferase family protein [Aeromonas enteropelogenes]|uniref:aminotransferase-like domain-containing protein n=1 Tax=Aeromonas enteropelogenes TaxID=29489 RepID=UPI00191E587B|nr:PLP-dependent aminotransferase family protein [Aeromonas enteropelogenes]MBL0455626.1 PLP-dependent aminotransferase family protein [Aeromonas enteropelogenes]
MQPFFAQRFEKVEPSFIREILKVAANPEIISFAGGLPNPNLFPVKAIDQACQDVLREQGAAALQYAATEGFAPLRQYIADRYLSRHGMQVNPDNILITSGSQQALDLLGKVLIDEGQDLIIEEPGYLGAIQAFSVYQPAFKSITLGEEGLDLAALDMLLASGSNAKLLYGVPNFQNPSGVSYSRANREALAERLVHHELLMVEDDPYGELRFEGEHLPPIAKLAPNNTVLLGSFSKTVVPAFRLGWMLVPDWLRKKVTIAKQATDLHSNAFSQQVLHRFLMDNSLDAHLEKIKEVYGRQRAAMEAALARHCPPGVSYTRPEGGMFLWLTLPSSVSAMALFDEAIKEKVAFVPGAPFYVRPEIQNTLRLSFSCVDEATIEEGVKRLCRALTRML